MSVVATALTEQSPELERLHIVNGEVDRLTEQVDRLIDRVQTDYESYSKDSVLYQYVHSRISLLADGELDEAPQLVIVHDNNDHTAFATKGCVVVGDSMIKELEYEEELDALLAHELTHIKRGHILNNSDDSQISRLGRVRVQELEADSLPIQLMDKKGINPWGIVSLINRFSEVSQTSQEEQPTRRHPRRPSITPKIGDIEHGSLADRRVNIEELLRVSDTVNLSPGGLTPIRLQKKDLQAFTTDKQRLEIYDQLGTQEQKQFILRQRSRTENQDSKTLKPVISQTHLNNLETAFVEKIAPDLTEPQRVLLKTTLRESARLGHYHKLTNLTSEEISKLEYSSCDEILYDIQSVLFHPSLEQYKIPHQQLLLDHVLRTAVGEHGLPSSELFGILTSALVDQSYSKTALTMWNSVLENISIENRELNEYKKIIADQALVSAVFELPKPAYDPKADRYVIATQDELKKMQLCVAIEDAFVEKARLIFDAAECASYCASMGEEAGLYLYETVGQSRSELNGAHHQYSQGDDTYKNNYDQDEEPSDYDWDEHEQQLLATTPLRKHFRELLSYYSTGDILSSMRTINSEGKLHPDTAKIIWQEIDNPTYFPRLSFDEENIETAVTFAALALSKGAFIEWANGSVNLTYERGDSSQQHLDKIIQASQILLNVGNLRNPYNTNQNWQFTSTDLGQLKEWKIEAYSLLKDFIRGGDWYDAMRVIRHLPLPEIDVIREATSAESAAYWDIIVEDVLNAPDKALSEHDRLFMLGNLAAIAPELQTRLDTPGHLFTLAARQLSFEEAVIFVTTACPWLPRNHFFEAITELIEERAHTPEELQLMQDSLLNSLESLTRESSGIIGKASLVDTVLIPTYGTIEEPLERKVGIKVDTLRGMEPTELLVALLSTSNDDTELRRYLISRWWFRMRTDTSRPVEYDQDGNRITPIGVVADSFKLEDITWLRGPSKQGRRMWWMADIPHHDASYSTFGEFVESIYSSGAAVKYYTLRKLLLGEESGVLFDEKATENLIQEFLKNWLDNPEDEAGKFIHETLQSLATVTNPELLYQHIYPLLMDIILRPPKEGASDVIFADELALEYYEQLRSNGALDSVREGGAEEKELIDTLRTKILSLISGVPQLPLTTREQITSDVLEANADLIRAAMKKPESEQTMVRLNLNYEINHRLENVKLALQSRIKPTKFSGVELLKQHYPTNDTNDERRERLSALDLLFILGERSGALGTRMLQLGGIYFDMSEEDREKFAHVYDDMKGQTRLQAWNILNREAERSDNIRELLDDVVTIEPRIGGGSLMTVYEAHLEDGSREAIAVKNPNIEYHLSKLVTTLDATLENLENKRADETRISLVRSLLSDVAEWINDELKDPEFEKKDAAFREANQNFSPGNNRYKIHVPYSKPTGTRWVRRDEYIEGTNLSGLTVTDKKTNIKKGLINYEDNKQMVSMLVRNYVHQMQTGLVHSDVHPGNFRITPNNKQIAIFDRYNLLKFDENERAVLKNFIQTMASGNVTVVAQMLADHILAMPENTGRHLESTEIQEIINATTISNADITSLGPELFLALKQSGAHVPIKYTLIMKNLLSLQRMSQKAGFSNIAEAFLATATPEEIVNLIQ